MRPRGSGFLLGSLVALLLAVPFLRQLTGPLVLVMAVGGVFLAGVIAVEAGRAKLRIAVVITVTQIGLSAAALLLGNTSGYFGIAVVCALVAMIALMLFSTYCVLRYVLRSRTISRDQIYAGISMYLMFGFAFGAVFHLVSILDPTSFGATGDAVGRAGTPDLMYFSFVTLATLGYGDIVPRTNFARSIAILEALVGMLYIAVFMARLVSLHAPGPDDKG